ncbi:MAG: aspartate/glutamate racemase family protein [Lautropia sp.]
MRIWEQGLVATYALKGYKALVARHYDAYRRPDTEIVIHGVKDEASETASRISGSVVNYAYLHRFHDSQIIENVRRAEHEGFDAVIIGVLQDPAIQVARTVVDIPVIGYGEVSMLTACMLGSRFSFVCINPDMDPLVRDMIRAQGLESRAAPTAYMACGYLDLAAAVDGRPEAFLDAFHDAARRAVRDAGVDVLLPGQTIIAELLWQAGVREVDGAVVLDPRLPLLRTAEMRVDLRRAGIGISRRGFYWQKPPADLVAALRGFYGLEPPAAAPAPSHGQEPV